MSIATSISSTSITLKSNNATIIPFSGWNNCKNHLGVAAHCMPRNDDVGSPLSVSLFMPSQFSVLERCCKIYHRHEICSEELQLTLEGVWKQHLSQSAVPTKSGGCLFSLSLSGMLLVPGSEYLDLNEEVWDDLNDPRPYLSPYKPFYDGPIAVIDGDRYLSLKDRELLKLPSVTEDHESDGAIGSFGQWLIKADLSLINLRSKPRYEEGVLPDPTEIGCHLSSPFLDDVENKELVLQRFATTSNYFYCYPKPWNCIIMAIDKSSGCLVYSGYYSYSYLGTRCWIMLGSMRKYTNGDLLYFNGDGNFYVLPYAQCGDLEVWRFQSRICSKISEIKATFVDDKHHNNSYHHIHSYLVESLNGKLLLVRRYVAPLVIHGDYDDSDCYEGLFKTDNFEVFMLNFESKQWEVVGSLGDEALFVGSNSSFSLSSTKYPEVAPNCIYFTDQVCHHVGDMLHGNDNGIFHLEDCTFRTLFSPEFKSEKAPIWLRPDERPFNPHGHDIDDNEEDGGSKS